MRGGIIEITDNKETLRKITIDLKLEGKAIDVALQYCRTDEEREFVQRVWDGLE